ncbi:MAG TPA: hypothetical protein PKC43_02240 [Phycisphaerales bacterium]|nr:hypothetical protein [Phycisphaerales bacterium]HMP36244.1 hypothetical protein [Phycisphaerales bacterium]
MQQVSARVEDRLIRVERSFDGLGPGGGRVVTTSPTVVLIGPEAARPAERRPEKEREGAIDRPRAAADESGPAPYLVAELGASEARAIAGRLDAAIELATRNEKVARAEVELVLASRPYGEGRDGAILLPADAQWIVWPEYHGLDMQDRPFVDHRLCLVLSDDRRSFAPVIVKLPVAAARSLRDELRAAAAE